MPRLDPTSYNPLGGRALYKGKSELLVLSWITLIHNLHQVVELCPGSALDTDMCVHLHEKDDPCVGHGIGQAQNPTAHDGIAQVEGGHAEGSRSGVLEEKKCGMSKHLLKDQSFLGYSPHIMSPGRDCIPQTEE